ncbi:Hypothetical predicted protein [Paramuricea clavata]|uniref:FP protein N-terminal domain-containing protein n=1 Tax=Paramuricea clavata TaxID=317549 RepID=A0A7D9DDP5_PARCT|nr:Hypothetical predicted protein [Paramuricea clavata]
MSIQNAEKDIKLLHGQTSSNKEFISIYDEQIDEIQQYLRRDCVEITGIPVTSVDDPKILAKELGDLMEVQVDERDISTAHRLPASKKVKDHIIVKFVNQDKRNEFYQR